MLLPKPQPVTLAARQLVIGVALVATLMPPRWH
jgi:hypothetical protein